jgi:hypothetical protein
MGQARKVPYSKGMSPAMAARWAFLCALTASFVGAVPASAERRPVAVVNLDLSDESKAKGLTDQLITELNAHPELMSLPDPTDSAALKDRIDDPDKTGLDAAAQNQASAEAFLLQFDNTRAETYADAGQRDLLSVQPFAALKPYANLAFLEGQAFLAEGRDDDARAAFAQCARLDPNRTLDAARYLPEVVAAYAKAKAASAASGSITIVGSGRAWIDGIEIGQAPGGFAVPAGRHVVWLTGPDRNVGGARTVVVAGKPATVEIAADTGSRRTTVQRARIALARAADATAKAGAMNNLAKLVGVADAVLLQVVGDKVIVQTWRAGNVDRAPGFSALREHGKEKPVELFTPLAPPKKIEVPIEPPVKPVKPVVVTKWYQRRPVQVGIVAAVIGAVVGGYFLSQAGPDSVTFNPNIGVITPLMGRK